MPQPSAPAAWPVACEPAAPACIERADSGADASTLSWVNMLLGWVWPKANAAIASFVHDDLTPRLQEALPSPFKGAHFSRFTLGQNTPEFGPIEVIRYSDSHVEVDLDMRYMSDVDVLLDAGTGGITLGVKQLTFSGRLCMVLRPVLGKWPVVGAVKVFFAAPPKVGLRFTGLASVAHYTGIEGAVQRAVDDWLRSRLVLPARKVFVSSRSEEDLDLSEVYSHVPLGVLRIRVLRARHLAGVNWSALATDGFTSDPYCVLRLGGASSQSSTVHGSTSPEWPADEAAAHFVVLHRQQLLELEVFGKRGGAGFLGSAQVSVAALLRGRSRAGAPAPGAAAGGAEGREGAAAAPRAVRLTLDTARVQRDLLHVDDPVHQGLPSQLELEAEWLDLAEPGAAAAPGQARAQGEGPAALLLVEIHRGEGFPAAAAAAEAGLRWRSQVETGAPALTSRRGEASSPEEAEFPELPIHPRLFPVIDNLSERRYSLAEIARVVGVESPELVTLYLQAKTEHAQRQASLLQTRLESQGESLEWNDVLVHPLREPRSARLCLALLDGTGREVGCLDPLPLAPLLEGEGLMPRTALPLVAGGTGLAWLRPLRAEPPPAERFDAALLELSVRLRLLVPGRGPPRGQSVMAGSAHPT